MADRQRRRQRRTAPGKAQGGQLPKSIWLMGLVPIIALVFLGFWAFNRHPEAPTEPEFTGGPRIAVDTESYDFGNVPIEKLRTYAFTIRNVGDQVLRLERQPQVRVLEGCWPPELAVGLTALAPGKKTTLEFPYIMHAGMEGSHLFEVVVKSNDPVEPEKKLTVKAVTGR